MPTTPSSDPHVPYLVSVTATRAELDSLSDAVADAVDGWREDGDARLVLAAVQLDALMGRIERSWRTESTQHAATGQVDPIWCYGCNSLVNVNEANRHDGPDAEAHRPNTELGL
jgi:hypothetical protein